MYLIAFPQLLIPFALYNMIAFLLSMEFNERVFGVSFWSGKSLDVSIGETLVLGALLLLCVEIFKSTRRSSRTVVDHVLSIVLFIAMVVELAAVQRAATSTFLILTAISLVDVIGGLTVTIRAAQRDVTFESPDARVPGGA
jgi:hypothetical protein